MNELSLIIQGDKVFVSSRLVAEHFEKRHDNTLRDIQDLAEGILKIEETLLKYFIETEYQHEQNKQWYKEYLLTKDGFALLAMGFTGQKALEWKTRYIEAFNKMEEAIKHTPLIECKQALNLFEKIAPVTNLSKQQQRIALIKISDMYGISQEDLKATKERLSLAAKNRLEISRKIDLMDDFISDKLRYSYNNHIQAIDLYDMYVDWCNSRNITPFSMRQFGVNIKTKQIDGYDISKIRMSAGYFYINIEEVEE